MAAPDDSRRTGFGNALNDHRKRLGLSQRTVADRVNNDLGTNYSDASVGQWSKGEHVPEPDVVFALEHALELADGDLSHHLGYVPVGSSSVLAAIGSDSTLTPKDRRALEVLYLTLASDDSS